MYVYKSFFIHKDCERHIQTTTTTTTTVLVSGERVVKRRNSIFIKRIFCHMFTCLTLLFKVDRRWFSQINYFVSFAFYLSGICQWTWKRYDSQNPVRKFNGLWKWLTAFLLSRWKISFKLVVLALFLTCIH